MPYFLLLQMKFINIKWQLSVIVLLAKISQPYTLFKWFDLNQHVFALSTLPAEGARRRMAGVKMLDAELSVDDPVQS